MKTLLIKFKYLPLKTKKTIYASAVIFFFFSYFFTSVLFPKHLIWSNLKYLMLIALILSAKSLRKLTNVEKGLPEDYVSPEKISTKNIVFIIVACIMIVGGILFYKLYGHL